MEQHMLEKSTTRKVTLRLIPFLFLCFFISILDRVNISFAALQMNEDLGFSNAVYGLGAGIFFLGYFLLEVPGSAIMTRIGARCWISRIMISWAIIAILMAFVTEPWQFYTARFLLGVAEASFYPCMVYYLSGFFQSKHHAKAIAAFMLAIPGANAVGAPLSTFLMQINWLNLAGWQWLFILEAVPAMILGIICFFYLDDRLEDVKWLKEEERNWLLEVTQKEKEAKQQVKHYTFAQALKDRDVLILSAGYFCWMFGYYGINMFLPTVTESMSESLSISTQGLGWLLGLMYAIAMVAMILVGNHSDKKNERRWHVAACLTTSAIAMIASSYVAESNIILSFVLLTIALCGAFGAYSPFWAIPPSFLTESAAAGAIALINSIGNLGGFFGPYAVGYIRDTTGSFTMSMFFLGISMILSSLIIIFLVKQSGKAVSRIAEKKLGKSS
ncbi:MFS transporter [Terribacillus saccharophilus]|uniref:MFS transporter n=1 Tax=Terribacillus saccharophilus TaxID=361277 RepID=A0ABX4GYG8_9BACI|nr:MFS transporter [Terribacillus saccharophilus]PAD35787.1 MFS transporter [Terribacillus saccharophilus]PAD96342.1 MFS transporter [Terribacillus saccharophilus]PAD99917.1 MFS transporter [Terribacillus saccharophilus]